MARLNNRKTIINKKLTPKKQIFADEYLCNGYDPRAAYRKIYPNARDTTVNNNAYVLLHEDIVADYITARREEMYQARMLDAIRVNEKLEQLAFDSSQSPTTQLTALKQLSKNLGLELDRKEIKVDTLEVGLVMDDET